MYETFLYLDVGEKIKYYSSNSQVQMFRKNKLIDYCGWKRQMQKLIQKN